MYEFSDEILKSNGHKLLKCRWGITVTHLYDMTLEHTKDHGECGFIHIFRLNMSLLISLSHVQFGLESSSRYIMMNSVLLGEGCYILPGIVILLLQIEHGAQCTIFLWNTQHRHGLLICCGVSLNFSS